MTLKHNKDKFGNFTIDTIITNLMMQDCYMYNSIDAPSELKSMILEVVSNTIDKILLDNSPPYNDEKELKKKLDKIKISYDSNN